MIHFIENMYLHLEHIWVRSKTTIVTFLPLTFRRRTGDAEITYFHSISSRKPFKFTARRQLRPAGEKWAAKTWRFKAIFIFPCSLFWSFSFVQNTILTNRKECAVTTTQLSIRQYKNNSKNNDYFIHFEISFNNSTKEKHSRTARQPADIHQTSCFYFHTLLKIISYFFDLSTNFFVSTLSEKPNEHMSTLFNNPLKITSHIPIFQPNYLIFIFSSLKLQNRHNSNRCIHYYLPKRLFSPFFYFPYFLPFLKFIQKIRIIQLLYDMCWTLKWLRTNVSFTYLLWTQKDNNTQNEILLSV